MLCFCAGMFSVDFLCRYVQCCVSMQVCPMLCFCVGMFSVDFLCRYVQCCVSVQVCPMLCFCAGMFSVVFLCRYVQEQLELDPTDPNYHTFAKIFETFKVSFLL